MTTYQISVENSTHHLTALGDASPMCGTNKATHDWSEPMPALVAFSKVTNNNFACRKCMAAIANG